MTHIKNTKMHLPVNPTHRIDEEDNYDNSSIPLHIDELLDLCNTYSKLGNRGQSQVQSIIDQGVEKTIKEKDLRREEIPLLKVFLEQIVGNPYFGDAAEQANVALFQIERYEDKVPVGVKFN